MSQDGKLQKDLKIRNDRMFPVKYYRCRKMAMRVMFDKKEG